jgi:hypothetical protein
MASPGGLISIGVVCQARGSIATASTRPAIWVCEVLGAIELGRNIDNRHRITNQGLNHRLLDSINRMGKIDEKHECYPILLNQKYLKGK